jgi:hypothetical protein
MLLLAGNALQTVQMHQSSNAIQTALFALILEVIPDPAGSQHVVTLRVQYADTIQ